jgi:hypothetical protein
VCGWVGVKKIRTGYVTDRHFPFIVCDFYIDIYVSIEERNFFKFLSSEIQRTRSLFGSFTSPHQPLKLYAFHCRVMNKEFGTM